MRMRILLVTLAVAGAVTATIGVVSSTKIFLLVGAALFTVALVMGALAAPSTRRGR